MSESSPRAVVFVPGGVTPAAASYAPLLAELTGKIEPLLKDLEVYSTDTPPVGYSLETEVAGLERVTEVAGFATFHLVGYSGGGAVSLAFCARHPERVRSLALFEPASIPGRFEPAERARWGATYGGLVDRGPDGFLADFTRRQVRPGVALPSPPPGPAPDWMAKRPAGLAAMMTAFETDQTDRTLFRRCAFPVYLAYGLLTDESAVERVQILAGLLPDVWIEAYEGVHHFAPPQRSQPGRYAAALRSLWVRAEQLPQMRPDGEGGYAA